VHTHNEASTAMQIAEPGTQQALALCNTNGLGESTKEIGLLQACDGTERVELSPAVWSRLRPVAPGKNRPKSQAALSVRGGMGSLWVCLRYVPSSILRDEDGYPASQPR
jgi:hypothetical protein